MRSAETAPASAGVQPSGYRKITPEMFLAYEKAKDYVGAQEGTGNPMIYLRAFQEGAPYLDLPSHAYQFVSMLVLTTQRQDWEAGSCPKSWLSQDYVCKVLGLGKSRVKALTRRLVEAKIFTMDDDAQGRRWGRRNEGGQIIEAHGFDLRLLAVRHQEFVEIAAAERRKRATMATLRERVRKGRRWIRQVSETLETLGLVPLGWSGLLPAVGALTTAPRDLAMAGNFLDQTLATVDQVERSIKSRVAPEAERDPSKREWLARWTARIAEVRGLIASAGATGNEERAGRVFAARRAVHAAAYALESIGRLPDGWTRLMIDTAELVITARATDRPDDLEPFVLAIEARKATAEGWLSEVVKPSEAFNNSVETSPMGPVCDPSNTITNLPSNLKDTVIASEESSSVETPGRIERQQSEKQWEEKLQDATAREYGLKRPEQLLEIAPRLRKFVYTATPNWKDVADGGYRLAVEELAVSPSCWARACEVMGREIATIAIAIVSTKEIGEITTSPARYFAGMVKLAVDGKLNLARSLWGAREARFGKPDRKKPN